MSKIKKSHRAIFLDRDGVINHNRPDHIKTWDEFIFLPRTFEALQRVAASDFLAVVMTNQSGVNRGSFTEKTLRDIHARMSLEIQREGGRIDAVFFCPHKPEEKCECRKARSQRNHIACGYLAWLSLKVKAQQWGKTLYAAQHDLLNQAFHGPEV